MNRSDSDIVFVIKSHRDMFLRIFRPVGFPSKHKVIRMIYAQIYRHHWLNLCRLNCRKFSVVLYALSSRRLPFSVFAHASPHKLEQGSCGGGKLTCHNRIRIDGRVTKGTLENARLYSPCIPSHKQYKTFHLTPICGSCSLRVGGPCGIGLQRDARACWWPGDTLPAWTPATSETLLAFEVSCDWLGVLYKLRPGPLNSVAEYHQRYQHVRESLLLRSPPYL